MTVTFQRATTTWEPSKHSGPPAAAACWRFLCRLFCLAVFLGSFTPAFAEKYLTIVDAQKVCFPEANRFELRTFLLTEHDKAAIRKSVGLKPGVSEVKVWLAWKDHTLEGLLIADKVFGKHDAIDYLVALAPAGSVKQVEILEYREQYGGEIHDPKWRAQFSGKTTASPLKLNEDIYNISGATISCRHVTEGIKRVLATYDLVVRPQLRASGDLDPREKPGTGPSQPAAPRHIRHD